MEPQDSDCGARAHSFLWSRGPSECFSVRLFFVSVVLPQTSSLVSAFPPDCCFYFQHRADSTRFHVQGSNAPSDLPLLSCYSRTAKTEDARHDIYQSPRVFSRRKCINLVCMVAIPERSAHHHMDADYKVKKGHLNRIKKLIPQRVGYHSHFIQK